MSSRLPRSRCASVFLLLVLAGILVFADGHLAAGVLAATAPPTASETDVLNSLPPITADNASQITQRVTLRFGRAQRASVDSPQIVAVAFSRDSQRVALQTNERTMDYLWTTTVRLWDLQTGKLLNTFSHLEQFHSSNWALNADLTRVAGVDPKDSIGKTIVVLDALTGQQLASMQGNTQPVLSVQFWLNDTAIFSTSSDNIVRYWDIATGKQMSSTVNAEWAAFMPDGLREMTYGPDRIFRMWNLQNGTQIAESQPFPYPSLSVELASNGAHVLLRNFDPQAKNLNSVYLTDLQTGQTVSLPTEYRPEIMPGLHFSPDGTLLAVSFGETQPMTYVWDVGTSKRLVYVKGAGHAVSPNSQVLATGEPLRLWEIPSGKQLLDTGNLSEGAHNFVFSPDGKLLVSYDKDRAWLWSVAPATPIRRSGVCVWNGLNLEAFEAAVPRDWLAPLLTPPQYEIQFALKYVTEQTCLYSVGGGISSGRSIIRQRADIEVTIVDVGNKLPIAKQTYKGGYPPDCPLSYSFAKSETSVLYTGPLPDAAAFPAWLKQTMAPYGLK